MLIGHRAIRAAVMGIAPRAATADEIARMEKLLDQALEEGGAGLSTGLVYAPAMHAQPEEIQALAKVVARRGGIYATHLRSEGGALLEAIEEALDVARASGVRLQISHLKTAGRANWHKLDAALESIRAAQAEGIEVALRPHIPYTRLVHGSGCHFANLAQGARRRSSRACAIRRSARRSARKWRRCGTRNIGKTCGWAARAIRTTRRSRASPLRWRRRRGNCIRWTRHCVSWRRTNCSPAASSSA